MALGYGENQLDVDFGYIGLGSIGDTVWYDANNNAIQETGEPGLRNVTVTLATDFDGDGIVDFQATTATDDSGNYLFSKSARRSLCHYGRSKYTANQWFYPEF